MGETKDGEGPEGRRLWGQLDGISKAAGRQLEETGLGRVALEQLRRPESEPAVGWPAAAGSLTQRRGALTEALRLWRSYAQHGFYLLMLDDAYPALCNFFSPPAATAAATGGAAALAAEELQQWCVAREAYSAAAQLCWHAARWARPVCDTSLWCMLLITRPGSAAAASAQQRQSDPVSHLDVTGPVPPCPAGARLTTRSSAHNAPLRWQQAPPPGWQACPCSSCWSPAAAVASRHPKLGQRGG